MSILASADAVDPAVAQRDVECVADVDQGAPALRLAIRSHASAAGRGASSQARQPSASPTPGSPRQACLAGDRPDAVAAADDSYAVDSDTPRSSPNLRTATTACLRRIWHPPASLSSGGPPVADRRCGRRDAGPAQSSHICWQRAPEPLGHLWKTVPANARTPAADDIASSKLESPARPQRAARRTCRSLARALPGIAH